jgi:hypothetical protein
MPKVIDDRTRTLHSARSGAATVTQAEPHSSTFASPNLAQLDATLASALAERFRVERVLGVGASGVVFHAFDRETGLPVAIKMLHRREPRRLYRLKREFRQLVEISHANLVAVHELFVSPSGHAFFTMDIVEDALSFLEYHRCPDPDRLRDSLVQLVRGVQELHAHRKLHRDLKPSNVLIDREHRLRIVDFELAASLHEAPFGAAQGPVFEGTPAYAAPEQADARRTTAASDWYAVGVMLYEVLAGAQPFDAPAHELLELKAAADPPPPSRVAGAPVPSALEHVCMRLLARDPAQRADGNDLLRTLGVLPPPTNEVKQAWPFVGRDAELRALDRAFEAAVHGVTGRPTLLEGSSGAGKTSLAQRYLFDLEHSERALVLRGRCFVSESMRYNALDGIVDALTNALSQLPAAELAQLLAGDLDALAQLFPVMRELTGVEALLREQPSRAPHEIRSSAVSTLRRLFAHLTLRRPIVLFVDDLHWADADSARVIDELFETALRGVWLLGTFRRAALAAREAPELERIVGLAHRLVLGPLERADVAALASSVLSGCSDDVSDEIAQESAGDAWLAQVLIRHASARPNRHEVDRVSPEAALRGGLAQLSRPARELLERICVAGGRLPRSLFLDRDGASMHAVRELRVASSARESLLGGVAHLEPYHDRVRELVLADLPPDRRAALHRWLAERLERYGSVYLDQAAQHYLCAGMHAEASAAAEVAARDATHACAFHSAADLIELALRCSQGEREQARLQLEAAAAFARAGRVHAAAQHYEAVAFATTDPAQRVDLLLQSITAYCTSGRGHKGRELLRRLAAELDVSLDFEPMTFGAGVLWMAKILTVGGPTLSRHRGLPRRGSTDDPALRLLWQTAPALMVVEPELALQFAVRAMLRAAELNDAPVYGQSLAFQLAVFVMVFGRSSWLLERRFAQAYRLARSDANPWSERLVRVMHGSARALLGDYERTVADCAPIAHEGALSEPFGASVRSAARALVIMCLLKLGRLNEFAAHIEFWQAEAVDTGDRHTEIACRVLGTQRHLRSGDVARALRDVEIARAIPLDYVHSGFADPFWLVQLALYRGDIDEAQTLYDASATSRPSYVRHSAPLRFDHLMSDVLCAAALAAAGRDVKANLGRLERALQTAERIRWSGATGPRAHIRATLASLRGEDEVAQRHVRAAIVAYGASGMRLHVASMQLALARLGAGDAAAQAATARAVFAAEGVRDPERWAAMVAPGVAAPIVPWE